MSNVEQMFQPGMLPTAPPRAGNTVLVGLARRLDRFLFEPTSPTDLAVCRVLFFLAVLLFQIPQNLAGWVSIPQSYWKPVWLFSVLRLPVITIDAMHVVVIVWIVALAMSCIGLLTRVGTLVALVLGAYVLGLPHNYGKVGHGDPVLVFTMLILAISRCGDALSVDAFIRARRNRPRPLPSGEYTWPIRMVWVLLAIVFCAAGATKMIRSGLNWIISDNLQILLLQHHYALKLPMTTLGLQLARHPLLCKFLAGATVAVELLFPLALFSRRLRRVLVPSAFLMQVGIGVTMGVYFTQFMICYLFWVPWTRLGSFLKRVSGMKLSSLRVELP